MLLARALRPTTRRLRCLSYLASIDQGTSSSRVILYDAETLAPVSSHQVELQSATTTPEPGWSQMDPAKILSSVDEAAKGALEKANASSTEVIGVGITNQRESTVCWDSRSGDALYDCILWHDARTRDVSQALQEKLGGIDALRSATGLPISTYFSGVKLKWLLDEIPSIRNALERGSLRFGTVDTWLLNHLTGNHVTDFTNASRTLMMDLSKGTWDASCIEALGLPSTMITALPTIKGCAEPLGVINKGPLTGCKITGVLGDQMAATVGQRCFQVGNAKITFGTGAFLLTNAGTKPVPSKHGLLSTALYDFGGQKTYALEGAVACCAVGLNWFRDSLNMVATAPELSDLAASVESTEGAYFVSAFSGLLAPRWRDDSRAALVGLTLAHDKRHIARAVLEGVALQCNDVIAAMAEDTSNDAATLFVDGGVAQSDVLLQMQADCAGIEVARPSDVETTALGAAVAAGLGSGVFGSLDDVPSAAGGTTRFAPLIGEEARAAKLESWRAAVAATYGWADRV